MLMSSRVGWIAGAIALGAVVVVVFVRPAPPADSPATSPALPEPAAVPESPVRGIDVANEVDAPEPPSREPPPLPAQAPPSEVVEAYRELARSMPANVTGGVPTLVVANETSFSAPPIFAKFAAEPIDPEWAPRAQTEIVSKFAEQPGLKLITLQVECRTTLCQVQMTQPTSAAGESPVRLLNTSGMQLLFTMTLSSQPSMQGSVAYLLRPGAEMPDLRPRAPEPPERR
jgi:hypothetical protein